MASRAPHSAPSPKPAAVPLGLGELHPLSNDEQRLRHLVEATPAITWSAQADGKVTYANQRLFEYTGLDAREQIHDWARRMVHPDDYPLHLESWRQARDAAFEIELRIRRHDGVYRWFLVRAVPYKDDAGRVLEWFGSATDIDERKRGEDNLRFLAQASAELSELADPDETLRRVAELAVPHFADWSEVCCVTEPGSDPRRLVVHHWDPVKLRHAEELQQRYPPSGDSGPLKVIRTGEPLFVPEVTEEHLRGEARDAEHLAMLRRLGLRSYMSVPMRTKSRVLGAMSFATSESGHTYTAFDLNTAEELAMRAAIALENSDLLHELKEADRKKDEFLAVLAHELRNPLAPVRNAISILRSGQSPSPKLQWTYDVIDRQVRQMSRLVDDLLDVSRIASGKIELRRERVELAQAVRIALETSRPVIERGGHQLTVRMPPDPIWVDADLARLAQILSNLLNNAAKYTHAGGHIWLSAEKVNTSITRGAVEVSSGPGEVVLRIRDNGIGIAPEMLRRIFDMFTQAGRSGDQSQGGLGIGLTLVKRLAEMHGGHVEAHSEGVGRGSEFLLRMPLSAETAANDPHAKDAEPEPAARPRRILVVDDNRDAADSLSMLLHTGGHEVRVAYDGLEAVGAAVAFRPDVVLLDIGLPKLSGYEAARRIRDARGSEVLLVAVTGWGQAEDRRRAQEAGFDHHLTKPVDPEAIARLIDGLPERRRASR